MKALLIGLCALLLAGCSLFQTTPDSVVRGQRAAYQGVQVLEDNINEIIDRYVKDAKLAVTYHLHYVTEKEILGLDDDWGEEYKESRAIALRKKRDDKIAESCRDIDKIASEMRKQAAHNSELVRRLVGAVYNYLSTTPIEIDGIDDLVDRFKAASEKK